MWPHSEGEKHYRCPRVPSATNFGQAGILKTAMRSCHGRELAYVPVLETCLHRLSNPTYWMRSLHLDIFQVSKPKNRLSLFGCLLSALLQEPRNSCWRLLQRPGGQPLLWGHNNDRCHSDKDWLKMYGMRNKVKKKKTQVQSDERWWGLLGVSGLFLQCMGRLMDEHERIQTNEERSHGFTRTFYRFHRLFWRF